MKILSASVHNYRSIQDAALAACDCTLLVGPNNAGKSNFIDALRVFYDDLKFTSSDDSCKCRTCADEDCWIDVEYALSDAEAESLKEEYRNEQRVLRLRKYLKTHETGADGKPKSGIYACTVDGVGDSRFYGWKNVGQGKLGKVIFVPAVSRLAEQTKLSGPSPFRDVLDEILNGVAADSAALAALGAHLNDFSDRIKEERTADGRSLTGLETAVNDAISGWNSTFSLTISQMSTTDILKNLVGYQIKDGSLEEDLAAEQFGEGFQRQLLFALLQIASEYRPVATTSDKKDFSGDLTLLLFEEPEAFLHPAQQIALSRTLRALGARPNFQVLATTHSPMFVSSRLLNKHP